MKPEIPLTVATPAEVQWVEAELIRSLLRTARTTQRAGLLLIPVFIGVLWDDAAIPFLLVWTAGILGSDLFLTRVSMPGVIAGTIWFVWGRQHLRIRWLEDHIREGFPLHQVHEVRGDDQGASAERLALAMSHLLALAVLEHLHSASLHT